MLSMKTITKNLLVIICLLAITSYVAIQVSKRPIPVPSETHAIKLPEVSPEVSSKISFSIVTTATAIAPEAGMFEGGSWLKVRDLAHSAMLICHPKGLIVFDTGLGREVDTQFKDFPFMTQQTVKFKLIAPLVDQVDFDEACPGRPVDVVLSHLHWDHAGGIEDLSGVPVWVVPTALSAANNDGVDHGFLPSQLDGEINWQDLIFSDGAYASYSVSKDIFSDGSVVAVPMQGHTTGSIGLFVAVGEKRLFLTGDTTWALEGFQLPAHKFAMMRTLADKDLEKLDAEILRVHQLMKAVPELMVIPAHDVVAYPAGASMFP